jgi:hypothetical protein
MLKSGDLPQATNELVFVGNGDRIAPAKDIVSTFDGSALEPISET